MLGRYPHTGKIIVNAETDNGSGIPTITKTELDIKGRFSPANGNKNITYSAKFYCDKVSVEGFELDGQTFVFEGKTLNIIQLFNYQMHCEIWLD